MAPCESVARHSRSVTVALRRAAGKNRRTGVSLFYRPPWSPHSPVAEDHWWRVSLKHGRDWCVGVLMSADTCVAQAPTETAPLWSAKTRGGHFQALRRTWLEKVLVMKTVENSIWRDTVTVANPMTGRHRREIGRIQIGRAHV